MTPERVRQMLRRRARKFAINKGSTGIRTWCEANDVHDTHVGSFLNGKRRAPRDLLDALGLEYRIMRKSNP